MSVEAILVGIWLFGWLAATVFAAAVIGNLDNASKGDRGFPAWIMPLCFGWSWPALLALMIVCSPLAWLAGRADKRNDKEPSA